jgi:GNAT superfamily N-acetyltransferase
MMRDTELMIEMLDGVVTAEIMEGLCEVLVDCVEGGASVGFMSPYGMEDAATYWKSVLPALESGGSRMFIARDEGRVVGTVQIGLQQFPNQPHRGDLKKLLVHRSARGRGVASALMQAAEQEAFRRGKTLLVLDTATGSPAEKVYQRLGWTAAGIIPDYALWPDGRTCATTFYYKHLSGTA